MALTEHAKQMIEKAGHWTMTQISSGLTNLVLETFPELTKAEARKVLARALASNIVQNEINQMVRYIVTGELPED